MVYALCGHGRGHSSRALAVAGELRRRGHRVAFAAGAPAADRLAAAGRVYRVPALRQVMRGNRVRMLATARANLNLTWRSPEIIAEAAQWLEHEGADLIVADHEPFLPRAARHSGLPVVALSHQLVLTETHPPVPLRYAASYAATAAGVAFLAPRQPKAAVIPSFFFPPLRSGSQAGLVPPILCDDVLALRPAPGERVLVYLNEGDGMDVLLGVLGRVDASFTVYGLAATNAPPNVQLRPPSRAEFLADLAAARAVVATAGFTLFSEALHLGTPVLALPNRGFFEQTVNALALTEQGRGEAVLGRPLREDDLRQFLRRADRYRRPPQSARQGRTGRERAADAIEAALSARRQAVLQAA